MKHLIPILLLFTYTFNLHLLSAAVPLRWTVETSRAQPATFEAYQGETLDFEATLQSYGKPLEAPVQYAIYWQTNGMGSAYWSAPVNRTIEQSEQSNNPTNVLRATWLPSYDVGARAYNCFIGLSNSIYHAAFQLRLRPSPGAVPNELPLPQKVIDFSQVTVLNPPWSGGGGSGGVDGAARPLPKYLHAIDFADSYPDDAAWYYAQPQDFGSCSVRRIGNFLERNYDWKFDDSAEFVVRMEAGHGRFASVGVANCGTNLTETFVTSGAPSRYYKCLPGHTVDGINEHGVVAVVNVTGGEGLGRWPTNGTIHCLGAVRWVLDHSTNAASAAQQLVSGIYFPNGWQQNFHWMIADLDETWIVENGESHRVDGLPVMTNFDLYLWQDGSGLERYNILTNTSASITNVWFTNAYMRRTDPPWMSEFYNVDEYYETAVRLWNDGADRESHRGENLDGETWWQTLHTSVYDITNRTLRIAVQENPDWYTFQVPSAGGSGGVDTNAVIDIANATIATNATITTLTSSVSTLTSSVSSLASNKLDKTGGVITGFVEIEDELEADFIYTDGISNYGGINTGFIEVDGYGSSASTFGHKVVFYGPINISESATNNVYTKSQTIELLDAAVEGKLDKTGGEIRGDGWDTGVLKIVQDVGQEFTRSVTISGNRIEADGLDKIDLHFANGRVYYDELDEEGMMGSIFFDGAPHPIYANGVPVATTNDLAIAISTNNPAFVSAVQSIAPPPSPTLRLYDEVRGCWWIGRMVNGIITWEVED